MRGVGVLLQDGETPLRNLLWTCAICKLFGLPWPPTALRTCWESAKVFEEGDNGPSHGHQGATSGPPNQEQTAPLGLPLGPPWAQVWKGRGLRGGDWGWPLVLSRVSLPVWVTQQIGTRPSHLQPRTPVLTPLPSPPIVPSGPLYTRPCQPNGSRRLGTEEDPVVSSAFSLQL